MKRIATLVVALLVFGGVVVGYLRFQGADAQSSAPAASEQATSHARAGGASGSGARSSFPVAVSVGAVKQETVPITAGAVGYVDAPNVAVVRTRADGVVLQQEVTEGQTVKAGDVLFKLDDTAAQALVAKDQAAVSKDQATVDEDQKDLGRDQTLANEQAGTQQTLDQQQAAVKVAQGTLAMDQAQLKSDQVALGYMTITAPIAGRVGAVNTSVGNVVRAADTSAGGLLTITELTSLEVSFSVPERDLDQYRAALASSTPAPVSIAVPGDASPRATATLDFIDSAVDQTSGTVAVKAKVTGGADKLWPGQYVNVTTQLGAYANATVVPLIAVQQGPSGTYVFAVQPNNTVKELPVTVQTTTPDTAVLADNSGLSVGEEVVINGQLRLADGSAVSTGSKGATGAGGTKPSGAESPSSAPSSATS